MPRKPRELLDGGIYHVYSRGNNQQNLFLDADDFKHYHALLYAMKNRFSIEVFHYCLMSNHVHILVRAGLAGLLCKFMHGVQLSYTRYYKKKYQFVGHLYQGRFRSPRISEESYYLQCGRYIERNPVKAGMVIAAEQYDYSSARYYTLGSQNDLVSPNLYYSQMGSDSVERQKRYREFLKLDEPYAVIVEESLNRV